MKTRFTKKERNRVYKSLLKEADELCPGTGGKFSCWKLWVSLGRPIYDYVGKSWQNELINAEFPEWDQAFREFQNVNKWEFKTDQRIEVLKNCIKLSN